MCSPCGEEFGSNVPDGDPVALLSATSRPRSAGSGGTLSLPSCNRHRASPKLKLRHPKHELAQKEFEYNKASANERLLEKKLQKSTEAVEKLRKQLQAEQDILGRLVPAPSLARETTKQSLDGFTCYAYCCAWCWRRWRQKCTATLRQWNRIPTCLSGRSVCSMVRTESNADHSALLECVDGLLGEASALFLKNTNTSDIINIDLCL